MSKPKPTEASVKAYLELVNLTDDLAALDRKEFGLRVWSKLGSKNPPTLNPADEAERADQGPDRRTGANAEPASVA